MTFKKISTQFLAFCLIGLLCAEVLLSLQISGQNLSFFQNQFSNAENFGTVVFPGKQAKETRIVEIRRVRPENTAEFKKLPKISEAELRKLLSGKDVRVVTDNTIAASLENDRKIAAKNREEFARVFAGRPDLIKLFLSNKNDPNPEITLQSGKIVTLLSDDTMIEELLLMNQYLNNPQILAKNYAYLYTKFQERLKNVPKAADRFKTLSSPQLVAGMPLQKINDAIAQIVKVWLDFDDVPLPPIRTDAGPPACKDEEGTGNGGDSGEPCGAVNPNGLRAKITWPLENYNTCVRFQGRRGTCTAFGISAAVESAIAVNTWRYMNLSEQNLYKKQMLDWSPVSNYYGDGYFIARSVDRQLESSYKYPFETNWNYNKSMKRCLLPTDADGNGRLDDKDPLCEAHQHYHRSCVDYSDVNCSNTTHQARKHCYHPDVSVLKRIVSEICALGNTVLCQVATDILQEAEELEVCYYETNISGTSGYRITEANHFYGAGSVDAQVGVDRAKAFLAAKTPVVFSTKVPRSLRGATDNGGYVTYTASEDPRHGGHAILMTGYVDNEDLPDGIPDGAGGGYFIIKNSWACEFGDQGYAYLPYAWVKTFGKAMTAVTSVGL